MESHTPDLACNQQKIMPNIYNECVYMHIWQNKTDKYPNRKVARIGNLQRKKYDCQQK